MSSKLLAAGFGHPYIDGLSPQELAIAKTLDDRQLTTLFQFPGLLPSGIDAAARQGAVAEERQRRRAAAAAESKTQTQLLDEFVRIDREMGWEGDGA